MASKASNLAGFVTSISPVNNLNVGVVTASSFVGNLDGTATTAGTAGYATTAGISTEATTAGYATTAGISTVSQGLTGTPSIVVGLTTVGTALSLTGYYVENITAMGALDVDCSTANYFTKTIAGVSTFTFSNVPSSGAYSFTLELTHTSGTITWPTEVKWPADTAPTLTTGKTHLFIFVTDDGGTRWRGSSLVDYTN
jgi:hypothetical protein